MLSNQNLEIFDSLPHGYCLIDDQYKIVFWNKMLEEWSGKRRAEMLGTYLTDLQPKLVQPDYKLRFDLTFRSGTPFVFSPLIHQQIIPCRYADGDGAAMQYHRTYLMKYKNAGENLALLVAENVSRSHDSLIRYRQLTNELEISKQRALEFADNLTQANDELSQFAYRTSHDLKSPVSTASALVKCVLEDLEDGDVENAVNDIKKIGKLMQGLDMLIRDIFALVKADLEVDPAEQVNVANVLVEIEERLDHLAEQNNCVLEIDIDQSLHIYLEKGRLTQILENIISNGIKYRDEKKDRSYVKIEIQKENDGVRLNIQDNGIGIPEKHRDDVFKMFRRFSPNHSFGSGLGMAIVKKHIDFLKGTIEYSSSEEGTLFSIYLPQQSSVMSAAA